MKIFYMAPSGLQDFTVAALLMRLSMASRIMPWSQKLSLKPGMGPSKVKVSWNSQGRPQIKSSMIQDFVAVALEDARSIVMLADTCHSALTYSR